LILAADALAAPAVRLCLVAAGVFFATALATGAWKYYEIARSEKAAAHIYVDIAHRAALLYSFAALLLAQFAALSVYAPLVNLVAAAAPLAFFAAAIVGYIVHGILRDTDNQFAKPHRIGSLALPAVGLHGFMWLLMAAEIGGFLVLFAGALARLYR
jgi:hypothetical protein